MMSELKHYYPDDETFTAEDGFNLAFGITIQDDGPLDESYGKFYLYEEEWAPDEEGFIRWS